MNATLASRRQVNRVVAIVLLPIIAAVALVLAQTNHAVAATGAPRVWRPALQLPRAPRSRSERSRADRQSLSDHNLPMWTGTTTSQGTTYSYTMVGKSPFVHDPHPRVAIDVPVISAIVHFPDGTTSDATKPTGCGESTRLSPTQLVAGSPIFQSRPYTIDGVFVGRGQYVDEFQRANFWNAIHNWRNDNYGVQLRPRFLTVEFSAAQLATLKPITDPYGRPQCGHQWAVDAFALDTYVQKTLIPNLHLQATSFPIFLGSNIFGYVGAPGLFDVAGNHGNYLNTQGRVQTYAEVEYDTSGFGPPDVSVLAHEVGEWMDDPLNNNAVPPIHGAGCQATPPAPPNGLEVGDPLEARTVTVGPMRNGVTYHPQELAFFSWFFNQVPSQAVNPAWYSSNGTFLSDSANTPYCF